MANQIQLKRGDVSENDDASVAGEPYLDNTASPYTLYIGDGTTLVSALNPVKGTAASLAADDLTAGDAAISMATSTGAITIDSNAAGVAIDGHTGVTIASSNSGEVDITSAAAVDINATTGMSLDATTMSIDGTDDSNLTVTGSAKDLDIAVAGGSTQELRLASAGTGASALHLNASAGGLNIDSADMIDIDAADEITIDTTSADGHIAITSAHTAGESVLISANANAGSILNMDAGIIDIDAQDTINIDAADEIEIATTSADGHVTLTSAHTAGVAFTIDANANAASELQIDAGILDMDVTGAGAMDFGGALAIASTSTSITNLTTGSIPDISSTYSPVAGHASIATVGTITSGTWQGTNIANNQLANGAVANLSGSNTGDNTTATALTGSPNITVTDLVVSGDLTVTGGTSELSSTVIAVQDKELLLSVTTGIMTAAVTRSGTTLAITTESAHGLGAGAYELPITGSADQTAFPDGVYSLTYVSGTEFTATSPISGTIASSFAASVGLGVVTDTTATGAGIIVPRTVALGNASITYEGASAGWTSTGSWTFENGAYDVNIPSHDDGTNGLSLGGTLITASPGEINNLDGLTLSGSNTGDTSITDSTSTTSSSTRASATAVKAAYDRGWATTTQGTTADNALPKAGGTMTGAIVVNDNIAVNLGSNSDSYILNATAVLAADAETPAWVEGTSDHLGYAANSLILSNVTDDGDMVFFVSDGGHSRGVLQFKGADGNIYTGGGADIKGEGVAISAIDGFQIDAGTF